MNEAKLLYESKYLKFMSRDNWEYVERHNSSSAAYIIPVKVYESSKERFLIFIREWRVPFQKYVVGFPAGLVGDIYYNELIIDSARRELEEETGYFSRRIRYLTSGASSSGLSNEILHFYLADKLHKTGDGGGDETEKIEVVEVPIDNAEEWLFDHSLKGDIIDIKSYLGLYYINKYIDDIK